MVYCETPLFFLQALNTVPHNPAEHTRLYKLGQVGIRQGIGQKLSRNRLHIPRLLTNIRILGLALGLLQAKVNMI